MRALPQGAERSPGSHCSAQKHSWDSTLRGLKHAPDAHSNHFGPVVTGDRAETCPIPSCRPVAGVKVWAEEMLDCGRSFNRHAKLINRQQ
eukprot:scaffold38791_cov19-Prasinocladus_malaysianus.AAC.2